MFAIFNLNKKLKRTEPGGSILLLKLTKLTNQTKQTYEKKPVTNVLFIMLYAKFF